MTDEQFTHLAEKYMDTVFRLAFSYMKSKADADDITQNVLLKLYTQEKPFESESHLKNWLIRVTINECKSSFRTLWRKTEDIADYANSTDYTVKSDGLMNWSVAFWQNSDTDPDAGSSCYVFNRLVDVDAVESITMTGSAYADDADQDIAITYTR